MDRLRELSATWQVVVSLVVLVGGIYFFVKLIVWISALLEWLQKRYWAASDSTRHRIKVFDFVSGAVAAAGYILGLLALWALKGASAAGWVSASFLASMQALAPRIGYFVLLPLITVSILTLFFISWCKSRRADALERKLEEGDLVHALADLELLHKEPGQNITVDVRVGCLYAYALVLAGQETQALEVLSETESRMSGSQKFQEMNPYAWQHQLRHNAEAIERMRLRIARVLCETGRYWAAIELADKRVSQTSIEVARLNVLGAARGAQGDLQGAERCFHEALEATRTILETPEVRAEVDNVRCNLARSLLLGGSYWEAAHYLNESRADLETRLAPGHPDLVDCLCLLGRARAGMRDNRGAADLFESAMDDEMHFLAMAASGMREADMLRLVRRMQNHFEQYIAHAAAAHSRNGSRLRAAMGHVLRRKGLSFQASAWTRRLSAAGGAAGKRLREVRQQLSDTLFAYSGGHGFEAAEKIAQLDAERRRLETEIAREGSGAVASLLEDISLDQVQAAIPAGGVLVEYILVRVSESESPRYFAFVLPRDARAPALHDLGPAPAIDELVADFQLEMTSFGSGSPSGDWKPLSRSLHAALVEPWQDVLRTSNHVVLSPDAVLHLLPFAALLDSDGRYLIERAVITTVSSGRDLVQKPRPGPDFRLAPPLLMGDPAYDDRPPGDGGLRMRGLGANPVAALSLSRERRVFPPLPGTRQEIDEISLLLSAQAGRNVTAWTGRDASKPRLLAARRPGILHVATHAYFLPPPFGQSDDEPGSFLSGVGFSRSGSSSPFEGLRGLASSPYLRSGLALAGANHRDAVDGRGVLTAEEVLSMDLAGTDVVILSACETAVGIARAGEGVQGLHRAFMIAGARNVIASLWKVSDEWTAWLMRRFYAEYLASRKKSEALRNSMLALLAELRRSGADPHPALWSAFECFGPPD